MGTKHQSSDPITDAKKRRRVGFAKIDTGIEANECIKIYLVSSKEEVDAPDSFCVEPIDLNHFFEEDGKIYGYQGLKITIWVSSISFHAYADVTFESTSDGGKGITNLKSALQNIFAENLVETKDDFLQTFSTECHYVKSIVSNGEILQQKASNGYNDDSNVHLKAEASDVEVVRVVGSMHVGHLYSRLVPFALLLVDGSNPIDITDPRWEIYLLVQKKIDQQGDNQLRLLGFAAVYRFYLYPDGLRLRLSQILVLPPYQHRGHGRCFIEVLNTVAIRENVYDLTVEEPSDSLQHVRTCIDVLRLHAFYPIQDALNSVILRLKQENLSKKSQPCHFVPPVSAIEDVRKSLKINRKQFLQCWEVLIYVSLDPIDKYMETYRTIISDRIKADVIGKETGPAGKRVIEVPTSYDQEMSFVLFKSQNGEASSIEMDENQISPEEQLQQLVDMRMKEIKLIVQKVSLR
ncbi:histone acetyltransferase type B catalytic subunit [Cornus florida]|uniref:histone acetyltransferase type B catalytic subunit n=1 Tax=Cornus florida TaxID=4283 RepID=UPI002896D234|nr:histone acetyltransferase type B catalytic subunit [Cornus florida]